MKAVAATALTGIEVLSLIYCNVNTTQWQVKFESLPCSGSANLGGPCLWQRPSKCAKSKRRTQRLR